VKPGQFHCLIRQCTIEGCEEWFIGTPASRYCDPHKKTQYAKAKAGWQRAHRNGLAPGRSSKFSAEEIKEMQWMYLRYSVDEIAAHFECSRKTVYKYVHRPPRRLRVT
jgi:DNA-binding CsgD family transcriptional regulator